MASTLLARVSGVVTPGAQHCASETRASELRYHRRGALPLAITAALTWQCATAPRRGAELQPPEWARQGGVGRRVAQRHRRAQKAHCARRSATQRRRALSTSTAARSSSSSRPCGEAAATAVATRSLKAANMARRADAPTTTVLPPAAAGGGARRAGAPPRASGGRSHGRAACAARRALSSLVSVDGRTTTAATRAPLQAARRSDAGERDARGRAVRAASAGRCRGAAPRAATPLRLSAAPPRCVPRAVGCRQRRGRRAAAAAARASPRGAVTRRRVRGCRALAVCARARRRQGQSQDAARRGILRAAGTGRCPANQRASGREKSAFRCVSPIARALTLRPAGAGV